MPDFKAQFVEDELLLGPPAWWWVPSMWPLILMWRYL